MLWHLERGGKTDRLVEALKKRGAPVPAALQPPEMLPGIEPWFLAFWELSTDRRFPGGPIPWSSLMAYPVSPEEADAFRDCIRAADRAYLEHISKPAEEPKQLRPGMIKGR